jgi:hypothetical protein
VHDGCSAVSASFAHPLEDLLVGLDLRPRRELAVVVLVEGRLVQDRPGHRHRLDPLLAVGRGRQVVELDARLHRGSAEVILTVPRVSAYIGPMCTW